VSVKLRFHVITVFPEMIEQVLSFGVVAQAIKAQLIGFSAISPRKFTTNVHQTIDDRPFGGGDGMLMMAEPMALAIESVKAQIAPEAKTRVIHLSPRGRPLTDKRARELASQYTDLVLIASRYAGLDQRVINEYVDEEISLGDYVVSGGELPALVLMDAVSRQVPQVLGNEASVEAESFAQSCHGGLEAPQFTRPREWREHAVPAMLLSGDHAKIEKWKKSLSILVTARFRPDLLSDIFSGPIDGPGGRPVAEGVVRAAKTLLAEASDQDLVDWGLQLGENSNPAELRSEIQKKLEAAFEKTSRSR
jgi:tRNA (guanine37-N1)-methyltransferase